MRCKSQAALSVDQRLELARIGHQTTLKSNDLTPDPTHVIGDLDCYFMPTSRKFGVVDRYARWGRPCMRE
jgi:hypothetical protein